MFNALKNKFAGLLALALVALTVPGIALAGGGGVDVSGVVTAIQAAATPIGLIGAAVLLILVAIKVYKWVRRAM
jgi:hypothetical protein